MPGENEEAMRIILMLGQAVLPPARELLIMTMRSLSRNAGKVVGHAGSIARRGANRAVSHFDGLGRYGQVTERTLRRDRNDTIKLVNVGKEGALEREDISLLAEICRRHRIGFSVFEDPATGYFAIEYRMKDEQALSACIETAVARKMISPADVQGAFAGPAPSNAIEDENRQLRSLPPASEKIEYLDDVWRLDHEDSSYKMRFTGWDGLAYTAAVTAAGDYRITDQAGRIAKIGTQACEGKATGTLLDMREEALSRCRAEISTLKDVEAFAGTVKMQERAGRTRQMGSKDLIRAVNLRDAQDRMGNRRQIGAHARPETHTRSVSKRVKR